MKSFFSIITGAALRFRAITLTIAALIIFGGIVAGLELKQELIPPVEFPQTFVIAQAAGMTSEEVLTVVTERLETEIMAIPEIVNVDSQTSGTFGAFIIASNDFGLDQQKLQRDILTAIDKVWFPSRSISPAADQDAQLFAANLMADLDADLLIYIADRNPNFLFQLEPEVWSTLSEDTVRTLLGYLANNVAKDDAAASALTRLIEQEVVPQLNNIDIVAQVDISGGQRLPDADGNFVVEEADGEVTSLLLQLSPDVWRAIQEKTDVPATLDNSTVQALSGIEYTIPENAPVLPESWQVNHFEDTTDILEMGGAVRSVAGVFNDFIDTGVIKGAPGTTEDLTPEMVERMLEIEPSLVQYFSAEQLAAMPDDVFAVLPDEYVDGLDGFTRDALAAKALAASITGADSDPEPVSLPSQWRITPPQLLTFSFADLPLATFSVFTTTEFATDVPATTDTDTDESSGTNDDNTDEDSAETSAALDLPDGNDLPQLYGLIGELFGAELDTADDLVQIQLSDEFGDLLGSNQLTSAEFLNLTTQFSNFAGAAPAGGDDAAAAPEGFEDFDVASFIPALAECGVGLLSIDVNNLDFGAIIVGCLDAETAQYLIDNDPSFPSELQADVIGNFSDEVLALDGISPLLDNTWNTLAGQPQFTDLTLNSADDILNLGDGSASSVLNNINATVPERFAGYEIRLFDSLTPTTLRYFASNEDDFYANLDADVLLKLSPAALAELPEDVTANLDEDTAETITAIASGEEDSAAAALTTLYTSDIPAGDPDAPAIGEGWAFVGDFFGLELDSADDFFRFPDDFVFESPGAFINGLFEGPGSGFASDLMQSLTVEQVEYMLGRDGVVFDDLRVEALTNLNDDVLALLPDAVQRRAEEGGERFVPATTVTRNDGLPSLLVTIFKDSDANTVEAFYAVSEVIDTINAENDNIDVQVAFEQSSFIEDSIAGVIREGSLGAVFAIINILIFLSGDTWGQNGRRTVGTIVIVVSVLFMGGLLALGMSDGLSISQAFDSADTVLRILSILGIISGFLILFLPGTLPYPAWRSTVVIGVSIPLSILSALALMQWLPPVMNGAFGDIAAGEGALADIFTFILRLAPENLTLNIMTLSGLTVAVGRVVDDSIVVLENIFRQMQSGMDKREAILSGTRDVSAAIFSATGIAVVVFLPLGLTGGLIGEFFLPFGLAVTYSLLSSFLVAITVVPVVSYIFINVEDVPEEKETWMQRAYVPILSSVLSNPVLRWGVIVLAIASLGISVALFGTRPVAFLPDFGEPQISVNVELPSGTPIIETNEKVEALEAALQEIVAEDQLSTVSTIIGSGALGLDSLIGGGGGGVSENLASVTISIRSNEVLEASIPDIEAKAQEIFGEENVTVAGGTIGGDGFGGFELIATGSDPAVLAALDPQIIETLNNVDGLENVSSNLSAAAQDTGGPTTYIRVNAAPALSYTGEVTTEDTIGIANDALDAIAAEIELPDGVEVGQGFDSQSQAEGFVSLFFAIGIALVIVVIILLLVFQSAVYWLALILSVMVAPVGAAIALTITDRVLGISAMIGMLMLLGLVVTNAIVLIDRVASNRHERGMNLYDALVEAGARRVRPILMTAIATIIALMPLAIGLSEGAIIASELGTVVIGGVVSSTLLTLIVVPAAYYLLTPIHEALAGIFKRGNTDTATEKSK